MSIKQTKTRQDILDSLQTNLPAVVAPAAIIAETVKSSLPTVDDISVDVEEDYNFARDHING